MNRIESDTSLATQKATDRRLIMLVDDSRWQRRLLARYLEGTDFDVVEAESGAEALRLFRQRKPDFILSDWVMENMTGPELCAEVRELSKDSYTYFILLTSKADPADIAYGLENGADDFLTKPTSSAELRARLCAAERILQLQERARRTNAKLTEALRTLHKTQSAMERDLKDARKLQQGLIGERSETYDDFAVSNIQRPAGHVGGDLTGSFAINARRFGVFAIDVSGHGVAAALLTARLATQFSPSVDQNAALLINEFGLYEARPPAVLARYLNHLMLTDLQTDTYFTMVYAMVDQMSGEVCMVQAGHPHPIVQRSNGKIEMLGKGGYPIGIIEDAAFEEISLTLEPGDRLLIASDGLSDTTDASGAIMGESGLAAILRDNPDARGSDLCDELVRSVGAFSDGQQSDDISAVLIERFKPT